MFPQYQASTGAVVRAVNRSVGNGRLKRASKGSLYVPRTGALGDVPISDNARVRDVLYRNGQRCGYITGPALYNRLGITTQVPKSITVATNSAVQTKDFGTIRVNLVPRRAPISDSTVPLLEIPDALRDAKKISNASVGRILKVLAMYLISIAPRERRELQRSTVDRYSAGTTALLGLLLTPELLSAVGRLVVRSDHAVARKKPGAPLRGRCDSFAVETDVHYPTDVNLLWDAMRCLIRETARTGGRHEVGGWRQWRHVSRGVKALFGDGRRTRHEPYQRKPQRSCIARSGAWPATRAPPSRRPNSRPASTLGPEASFTPRRNAWFPSPPSAPIYGTHSARPFRPCTP